MLPPQLPVPRAPAIFDPDEAIRLTDDDAAASRLSAASLNYLPDPFSPLLYKPPLSAAGPSRKPPLINVGTHHRTYAIDLLVDRFLACGQGPRQVVSLGAGSDTRFWRMMCREKPPELRRYVELDFPHITSIKAQRISRNPKLSSLLSHPSPPSSTSTSSSNPTSHEKNFTISRGGTALSSPLYTLHPLDLRQTPSHTLTTDLLPLLDLHLPTLFLAECVFCYMQPAESREIISFFGRTFDRCCGVVYEMVGLQDTFGRVMRRNLASRQLSLPGAEPFRNARSQALRFLDPALGHGVFEMAGAKTLWDIRESTIPPQELARISKLEHLDEIEELRLVLSHYVVTWGTKGVDLQGIGL